MTESKATITDLPEDAEFDIIELTYPDGTIESIEVPSGYVASIERLALQLNITPEEVIQKSIHDYAVSELGEEEYAKIASKYSEDETTENLETEQN